MVSSNLWLNTPNFRVFSLANMAYKHVLPTAAGAAAYLQVQGLSDPLPLHTPPTHPLLLAMISCGALTVQRSASKSTTESRASANHYCYHNPDNGPALFNELIGRPPPKARAMFAWLRGIGRIGAQGWGHVCMSGRVPG